MDHAPVQAHAELHHRRLVAPRQRELGLALPERRHLQVGPQEREAGTLSLGPPRDGEDDGVAPLHDRSDGHARRAAEHGGDTAARSDATAEPLAVIPGPDGDRRHPSVRAGQEAAAHRGDGSADVGEILDQHGRNPRYWTTRAVTIPYMPWSVSAWLRMWQCHAHAPTWSAWMRTV